MATTFWRLRTPLPLARSDSQPARFLTGDDASTARRIATQTNLGLNDACVGVGVSGTTFTCTQADGGTATATLPSGGGGGTADGYLTAVWIVSAETTRSALYTVTGATDFNAALPMPWAGAGNQTALDGNTRVLIWDEGDNPDSLGYMTTTAFASALSLGAAPYDDARFYTAGVLVETGSGRDAAFWIAPESITSGQGAPSVEHPGQWFEVAVAGGWRGELDI